MANIQRSRLSERRDIRQTRLQRRERERISKQIQPVSPAKVIFETKPTEPIKDLSNRITAQPKFFSSEISAGKGRFKESIRKGLIPKGTTFREFVRIQGEKEERRQREALNFNQNFKRLDFVKKNLPIQADGKIYFNELKDGKTTLNITKLTPERYVELAKQRGNNFIVKLRPITLTRIKVIDRRSAKEIQNQAKARQVKRAESVLNKFEKQIQKGGTINVKTSFERDVIVGAIKQQNKQITANVGTFGKLLEIRKNNIKTQERVISNIAKKFAPKGIDIGKFLGTDKKIRISLRDAVANQNSIFKKDKKNIDNNLKNINSRITQIEILKKIGGRDPKLDNELKSLKNNKETIQDLKAGLIKEFKPISTVAGLRNLIDKKLRLEGIDIKKKKFVLTKKGIKKIALSATGEKFIKNKLKNFFKTSKVKLPKTKKEFIKEVKKKLNIKNIAKDLGIRAELVNKELDKQLEQEFRKVKPEFEKANLGNARTLLIGAQRGIIGIVLLVTRPKEVIAGLKQAIKRPIQTLSSEGHRFNVDTVGVIGEYLTFGKVLRLGATKIRRSPVGQFVQKELFIRAQPKQLQKPIRAILESSRVQRKINPFKVKNIKKSDFLQVKALNKVEVSALLKTLKQTDSVIFGSLPARILSKGTTKVPKDVDLATRSVAEFNKKFINNLPENQKGNYIVKKEKIIRRSNKEAILDVKPINRLIPQRSLFSRTGFIPVSGYVRIIKAPKGSILPKLQKKPIQAAFEVPTEKVVKIGKFKLVGFGEQTVRKGLGTIQVLVEKNIKRAKDPQAFIESLQVQVQGLKLTKPKTKLGKIRKNSKIKKLNTAIAILTSKKFLNLLKSKVPTILKDFPITKKINIAKLRKAKKLTKTELKKKVLKQIKKKKPEIKKKTLKKKIAKRKILKKKQIKKKIKTSEISKLPPSKLSKLPASRLSKLPPSKLSKLPPSKLSNLPSSVLSKLPSSVLSKLPSSKLSKLPPSKLSKLPPSKISNLPSSVLSKLPSSVLSKLPAGRLSNVPLSKLSKLPISKIGKNRILKEMSDKEYRKRGLGFNILVKKRGRSKKFQRLNNASYRKTDAKRLARFILENTPLASGIVTRTGTKVNSTFKKDVNKLKFRLPKGKTRLPRAVKIVEKRKHRINTRGEKIGITLKGIKTKKTQRQIVRLIRKKSKRKIKQKK